MVLYLLSHDMQVKAPEHQPLHACLEIARQATNYDTMQTAKFARHSRA